MIDRAGPWLLRAVWLVLPGVGGPALAAALDGRSAAVVVAASVLAWALWAAGLVASLVPRAIGLTVLRVVAPIAVAASIVVAFEGGVGVGLRALALAGASVAALVVALPSTGELLVDGSSYGDEHRVLLRVPAALLLGPLALAWAVIAATAVVAPLLLAAEQWVAGGLLAVVGGPASWLLFVRLHQLSRRWLVFVPAGVVVHDPLALGDPVLFPRPMVASFGPAPLENPALDLTRGALGLALMIAVNEPIVVTPVRPGEDLEPIGVDAVLVTPTRPGHVLRIAQERRLPVG